MARNIETTLFKSLPHLHIFLFQILIPRYLSIHTQLFLILMPIYL